MRRFLAELVGTAFLGLAVAGSGIAAETLSPRDEAMQLLVNALATGAALVAIIVMVGAVSGAHLNPAITLADRAFRGVSTVDAAGYVVAQVSGAIAGVVLANVTFSLPAVEWSTNPRASGASFVSEMVATMGLVLVVSGVARSARAHLAPFAVAGYITSAYFFASSTSFANPAITIGRAFTDTFTGIDPSSVVPFIVAQCFGAGLAIALVAFLYPNVARHAGDVVVPHVEEEP
jgi:arsenate reductase